MLKSTDHKFWLKYVSSLTFILLCVHSKVKRQMPSYLHVFIYDKILLTSSVMYDHLINFTLLYLIRRQINDKKYYSKQIHRKVLAKVIHARYELNTRRKQCKIVLIITKWTVVFVFFYFDPICWHEDDCRQNVNMEYFF